MTEPRKSRENARRRVAMKNVKENEIDDPFALFDEEEQEEETEEAEPTPEPPNPELEDLRQFKAAALASQREGEIGDEFEKQGFTPKLAKLWSALNPAGLPTAESVREFADEYGVAPEQARRLHPDRDR